MRLGVLYFQNLETRKSTKVQKLGESLLSSSVFVYFAVFFLKLFFCNNLSASVSFGGLQEALSVVSCSAASVRHRLLCLAAGQKSCLARQFVDIDRRVDILSHSFSAVQDIVALSNVITASEKCGQWTQAETRN